MICWFSRWRWEFIAAPAAFSGGVASAQARSNNKPRLLSPLRLWRRGCKRASAQHGSFELTLDAKDVTTLYYIQKMLGFGNIRPRSKVKAFRIRTGRKKHILFLLSILNGKLLTPHKQDQLRNWCQLYNVKYIKMTDIQRLAYLQAGFWVSGFFDAEVWCKK